MTYFSLLIQGFAQKNITREHPTNDLLLLLIQGFAQKNNRTHPTNDLLLLVIQGFAQKNKLNNKRHPTSGLLLLVIQGFTQKNKQNNKRHPTSGLLLLVIQGFTQKNKLNNKRHPTSGLLLLVIQGFTQERLSLLKLLLCFSEPDLKNEQERTHSISAENKKSQTPTKSPVKYCRVILSVKPLQCKHRSVSRVHRLLQISGYHTDQYCVVLMTYIHKHVVHRHH